MATPATIRELYEKGLKRGVFKLPLDWDLPRAIRQQWADDLGLIHDLAHQVRDLCETVDDAEATAAYERNLRIHAGDLCACTHALLNHEGYGDTPTLGRCRVDGCACGEAA